MLGMSFPWFTVYFPQRLTPLPTDIALLQCLCCVENNHLIECSSKWKTVHWNGPGIWTVSLYKSILPLEIFAKQSYSLISNPKSGIDFCSFCCGCWIFGHTLHKVSGSYQVISSGGIQHFPMEWAFLPKVPAQSTALLLFKESRHIKPPKSLPVQCQVSQPPPCSVLGSVNVPNASFLWAETLLCAKLHPLRSLLLLSTLDLRGEEGMWAHRQGTHFTKFLLIFRKFTTEPQTLKEQCDCHKEQCGKTSIHACAALPHAHWLPQI